jgi:glycerate dehydrogenase
VTTAAAHAPGIVILDSFTTDQGDPAAFWRDLGALGALSIHARTTNAERRARCSGALAVLANKVAVDADLLGALPDLRYVGVMATGTNVVDLEAARRRSIAVTNVPGYATESVATLVFGLILGFTHDVAGHDADVKAGRWAAAPDFCFFRRPLHELAGKTMAVVGSGAIGGAVARIAGAFGMDVVRATVPGSASPGRVPLAQALPRADVVSLHCPLTPATRGLVGRDFLAAMKRDAILINTGRGALIDDAALIEALSAGRLLGVGLDVLAAEPPPADHPHPLLAAAAPWAGRLLVTPHIGWGTIEARRRLAEIVTLNLKAFLAGQRLNRVD